MTTTAFDWPLVDEFVGRDRELARLQEWWAIAGREPMAVIGRRRVGKSWLLRRFAHGKPAVILVADQLPEGVQLARFADSLEGVLGVRPELPDLASLVRVLHRAASDEPLLVVIDEFPWLLGSTASAARRSLTAVQAVIEDERERSQLKLVLCGSHVAKMESLFGERNPLHGLLERLVVRPMSFGDARPLLSGLDPIAAFERYAVGGGMPMYLARLGSGSLRAAVCRAVLGRDAPLWNEGRAIVDQELREPRVHFAILIHLATGAKALGELGGLAGMDTRAMSQYLATLTELRLVSRSTPFGAPDNARTGRWQLDDPFLRFWFRYVFPFQADLDGGLPPGDLYDHEVAPTIARHVAPVFESWCLDWLRANRSDVASRVGRWWGNAANEFRRTGERTSEEIDAVGSMHGRVVLVAEAKWTSKPVGLNVVDDLLRYKLPALAQVQAIAGEPRIVLFSKSGYTNALIEQARLDERIDLVDVRGQLAA